LFNKFPIILHIFQPEYVVVAKSLDDDVERIELPTELDNTLGLQTLV